MLVGTPGDDVICGLGGNDVHPRRRRQRHPDRRRRQRHARRRLRRRPRLRRERQRLLRDRDRTRDVLDGGPGRDRISGDPRTRNGRRSADARDLLVPRGGGGDLRPPPRRAAARAPLRLRGSSSRATAPPDLYPSSSRRHRTAPGGQQLTDPTVAVEDPALSPDGTELAYAAREGAAGARRPDRGRARGRQADGGVGPPAEMVVRRPVDRVLRGRAAAGRSGDVDRRGRRRNRWVGESLGPAQWGSGRGGRTAARSPTPGSPEPDSGSCDADGRGRLASAHRRRLRCSGRRLVARRRHRRLHGPEPRAVRRSCRRRDADEAGGGLGVRPGLLAGRHTRGVRRVTAAPPAAAPSSQSSVPTAPTSAC